MSNFLDDICFMNWRDWYGKLYICGKPVSLSLTGCKYLNIGDILMLQKENEALDKYIVILSTKVAYGTDACGNMCWL